MSPRHYQRSGRINEQTKHAGNHTPAFKGAEKVALAAIQGPKTTLAELAQQTFGRSSQPDHAMESAPASGRGWPGVFSGSAAGHWSPTPPPVDVKSLHAKKIGELTLWRENDFWK